MQYTFLQSGNDSKRFSKRSFFRIGMWNSSPPPLHGKNHLKFPFWLFEYLPYSLLLSIWSKKMQPTTLTYAFKQKLIHRTYNIYVQKRSRNFRRGKRQSCSLLHNEQLCCLLRLGYQRPIKKINSDQRLSARNSKNNFACFVFLAFKNFDLRLAKKLRLGKHYLTEAFKNILFFLSFVHISLTALPKQKWA